MNYVPSNPDHPICGDCGREYFAECGSVLHPGLDVWCAQKRILAEDAARDAERALEFQALSREHFSTDTIIAAAESARGLLGVRFHAAGLVSDREPITSSERDSRHLESA